MNVLSIIMAGFAIIGAVDRIIGNKLGLGDEFEKGLKLMGVLMLSMAGMIVLSPLIAYFLTPSKSVWFDFSIIPSTLLANDMGAGGVAMAIANSEKIGKFNGFVVSSMMGATVSFTIPYSLSAVKKEYHPKIMIGMLCGIATIPFGCFIAGLIMRVNVLLLIIDLLPLIVLATLIAIGLIKAQKVTLKIFSVIGFIVKALATFGLTIGIFELLSGIKLIPHTGSLNDATDVIVSAACIMSGAFPLIKILTVILKKPLSLISKKTGLTELSAISFLTTLASSVTTFGVVDKMDEKGLLLNSAFAVSASFLLADHLAYTLAVSPDCIVPMIIGKIVSGIFAVLATLLYIKLTNKRKNSQPAYKTESEPNNNLSGATELDATNTDSLTLTADGDSQISYKEETKKTAS